ncbi:Uma2 family endonuclease [Geitlerinema sp. P-1104]|uniref:Uma2 family endonuclease n=1 Tax=Geitlerinema sp. P-1104 TaxID=2546230 RepID=UPI0014768D74|nr:Uma2 family endonuclease [Geitlerinema sp. P-1104]NMG59573.1 Uma2 family endonuclease [Geitlerinema sp. P-1104]
MITTSPLTLDNFLALPESDVTYELLDGQAIPKMSPKFRHSRSQKKLLFLLEAWATDKGFVQPEWAVRLQRNGNDWVPVPDLLYISFERLSPDWDEDAPCPVAPELVIEIVSPGQSFGAIAEKASAYLLAGVLRVWVVDSQHQSLTVFAPNQMPRIYRQPESIEDSLFPELSLLTGDIF